MRSSDATDSIGVLVTPGKGISNVQVISRVKEQFLGRLSHPTHMKGIAMGSTFESPHFFPICIESAIKRSPSTSRLNQAKCDQHMQSTPPPLAFTTRGILILRVLPLLLHRFVRDLLLRRFDAARREIQERRVLVVVDMRKESVKSTSR
jgi:hypothetical protein